MAVCLSVKQPWAWAIMQGLKDVENRTWFTSYRGPLAIHAGKSFDREALAFIKNSGVDVPDDDDLVFGAVIGFVDIVDCRKGVRSRWAMRQHWHWVLSRPRPIDPVPLRGRLGLFNVDDELLRTV